MTRSHFLSLCSGWSALVAGRLLATTSSSTAEGVTNAWSKLIFIGASVTAGFTPEEPLGGQKTINYQLHRWFGAFLGLPPETFKNLGSTLLFMSPHDMGKGQILLAKEAKPSAIIGIDFLFWFVYGQLLGGETRSERLEKGLHLLESITDTPLLVGTVPEGLPLVGIVPPSAVPSRLETELANQRLRKWAATRTNVTLLPVGEMMAAAKSNRSISARGVDFPEGKSKSLIQPDGLHLTRRGCGALTFVIGEALCKKYPGQFPEASGHWDLAALYKKITGKEMSDK